MTTYADVVKKLDALTKAREAYIVERGWKRMAGRWWIAVKWGTKSERIVEADLVDAVRYQAAKDGELK